jgi:hypothetical protein
LDQSVFGIGFQDTYGLMNGAESLLARVGQTNGLTAMHMANIVHAGRVLRTNDCSGGESGVGRQS